MRVGLKWTPGHWTAGEQGNHLPVERWDVVGLAASHQVAVHDHLLIHPLRPGKRDETLLFAALFRFDPSLSFLPQRPFTEKQEDRPV